VRVAGDSTTVLITGSAGFVGSHLVELILRETDWQVIGLDSFRRSGDSSRISSASLSSGRYRPYRCDLSAPISKTLKRQIGSVDVILNLASHSSVDHSLREPESVVWNNVGVALTMLEFARDVTPRLFMQMSTDEVYGPAADGECFVEWSTMRPSNPYSASKAAQEAIALSYWRSFGVPLLLVNATNIIGERQDVEKFVPLVVSSVMNGREVGIHCTDGRPGSRSYLHVSDCIGAIWFLVDRCLSGGVSADSAQMEPPRFNLVGMGEVDNLSVARGVARIIGADLVYREVDVRRTRPGHDLRYALDPSKLMALGWRPKIPFEAALERTVNWFIANPGWL
jgi:dTDP-glucose 4,6-dehydratase